jgi:hypothetical protein
MKNPKKAKSRKTAETISGTTCLSPFSIAKQLVGRNAPAIVIVYEDADRPGLTHVEYGFRTPKGAQKRLKELAEAGLLRTDCNGCHYYLLAQRWLSCPFPDDLKSLEDTLSVYSSYEKTGGILKLMKSEGKWEKDRKSAL